MDKALLGDVQFTGSTVCENIQELSVALFSFSFTDLRKLYTRGKQKIHLQPPPPPLKKQTNHTTTNKEQIYFYK